MKPAVLRQRDGIQLSYGIPYQIYDSLLYPLRSSNGSTVIVCGHEKGITLIWYGGRRFAPRDSHAAKVNGTAKEDAMVIDLDEDELSSHNAESPEVEFADEEEEIDPTEPYKKVLRKLDIPLKTKALRIAAPHIQLDTSREISDNNPPFFHDRLIIVAACADLSIRLINLPLLPPGPDLVDISKVDIQIITIEKPNSHPSLISSVAITYTADTGDLPDEEEESPSQSQNRGHTGRSTPSNEDVKSEYSVLLASISCRGNGLLIIHQIPLVGDEELSSNAEHWKPIRRAHLSGPLMDAKLSFNPSPYPADRHSNLLIALPDMSAVKIYQIFSSTSHTRVRRGSTATADSSSSTRSISSMSRQRGKFLITLLPGFLSQHDSPNTNTKRKRVLDSKWILGGKAIITLLEDGQWGIWDLEAAGPSNTNNLVRGQGKISGIQGGAVARFAVTGFVARTEVLTKKSSKTDKPSSQGALAPMTPHTRKQRSDNLFKGAESETKTAAGQTSNGGINVTVSPANRSDESLILSFGAINVFIASLLAFWQSELTGRAALDISSGSKPQTLSPLNSGGEELKNMTILPSMPNEVSTGLFKLTRNTPNLLAHTNSRIILFVAPLTESSESTNTKAATVSDHFLSRTDNDQVLLDQGELDLDGMDRILEGMNGSTEENPIKIAERASFDVDMDSPSTGKRTKSQLDRSGRPARSLFT